MGKGLRAVTVAAAAALLTLSAAATVGPVGTAWETEGLTTIKVGKTIDTNSGMGAYVVLGPEGMVPAGRFYIEFPTGLGIFTVTGSYTADPRGRIACVPDTLSIAQDLRDRIGDILESSMETELGGPLDSFGVEVTAAAVKARVKDDEPAPILSFACRCRMVWTGRVGGEYAVRKGLFSSKGRGPLDL